jgi:hypothetical protein
MTLAISGASWADKIKHPTAVFSGLDKITGRIKSFEVAIDETAQFGTLQITPRVCFSRPSTEAPQTDVFAEVFELEPDKSLRHVFAGWMFADSPGLHGIEHPVYDIWLSNCTGDGTLIHEAPEVADTPTDPTDADPNATPLNPADPKAQAPKKPKKPKPTGVVQQAAPPPLDLTVPSFGADAPAGGRAGAGRRAPPFDAPPVPPADIQQ